VLVSQFKNTQDAVIRWGIIGCGDVTELKSGPAYQKVPGFELSAVMRRTPELAADYARRHNVADHYHSARDLIDNPEIDAVYIATPPDSHKFYALQVAQAGKPCCIEKPLAPTYEDSLAINKAFKRSGQPLFVAYYRRSLPRFNKVKELIDSGVIGQLRQVSWHLNKPTSKSDYSGNYNWRTDKLIARGGYFDDLASHGLDLFAYLFGDFKQVKGLGLNQQGRYTAMDAVTACWTHTSGLTGSGSWNFGGYSRKDKVVIYGSLGEISFSMFDQQPVLLESAAQSQAFWIENPENIQLHHVQNIHDQLVSAKSHPSTGDTACHSSWVMEKILAR